MASEGGWNLIKEVVDVFVRDLSTVSDSGSKLVEEGSDSGIMTRGRRIGGL